MTHQFVERLQDQSVAMREQKLTMIGSNGEPTDATSEIEDLWNEVSDYEKERQSTDPSAPYDKEMLAKKQKLQDLGVGMSNREATVDLTNPKTFVTPDEFEKVKGDFNAIVGLVKQKIGVQPDAQFFKGNVDSLEQVNDWIGVLSRVQALEPQGKYVDTKKTRLQMTTGQFAQTGGNVEAIRGKEAINAQIENRRKPDPSSEEEEKHLTEMVEKLGGDAKLIKLGVKDPSTLTVEQKFLVLSKGRVPAGLGGEAEPSIGLDENLSEEELRERLMKLPPKPPRNVEDIEDPFADDEDEDDEKEEEQDEKHEEVEAKSGGETRNKYLEEVGSGGYDPLAEEMKSNSPNDLKEESSSEESQHEEIGVPPEGGDANKYLLQEGAGGYDPLAEEMKSNSPNDLKEESSSSESEHEELDVQSEGGNPNKYLQQQDGTGGYEPDDQKEESSSEEDEHEEVEAQIDGGNPNKYLQDNIEDEEEPSSRPPKNKGSKVESSKKEEKESVDPFADDEEEEEEHEFPVAQQTVPERQVAKNVKDLNLKSQKPVGTPHPRQVEFDQLGGDQALLEKLLPPWKSRNQPVLNKLLDLNKRLKTAVGTDKEQLATAIKTLTTEIDKRDRMPTLNSLAKMPIDEKIDQLKN